MNNCKHTSLSSCFLNTPRDGDYTISLGSLFQHPMATGSCPAPTATPHPVQPFWSQCSLGAALAQEGVGLHHSCPRLQWVRARSGQQITPPAECGPQVTVTLSFSLAFYPCSFVVILPLLEGSSATVFCFWSHPLPQRLFFARKLLENRGQDLQNLLKQGRRGTTRSREVQSAM